MPPRPTVKPSLSDALAARLRLAKRAWHALIQAVGASLSPTEEEAWRTDAQLRLHRNGSRNSMMLMLVASLLVVFAFAPWVSAALRYGWFAVMTIICLSLEIINRRLDKRTGRDAANVAHKAHVMVASSVVFLTAWCSIGALFWLNDVPQDQMLLILILACSMAGTIALSASQPALAITTLVVHACFLIGPAAFTGTPLTTMLALLAVVFTALITGQLITLSEGTNRLLTLEHERTQIVRDLRNAKNESDRERGRATTAGRAKSQFLSHMNHELRTPMNAILGFSEIIKSKSFGSDVDKYAEYATIIHDSGNYLLSLINGMLDLAKIDGGKLTLKEEDVNVARLISDAVGDREADANLGGVTVTTSVQRGLPHVTGDERALRQVVVNLLSNAIKFTPPNGNVKIFANTEEDGRLSFGVEDNGIGIAREDQPHVFERFGHSRADVTTQQKGTGLGLAVVKGFVEGHDGKIVLESEAGSGTRVTVTLPRERVGISESARLAG